jgi:hypothetical protein
MIAEIWPFQGFGVGGLSSVHTEHIQLPSVHKSVSECTRYTPRLRRDAGVVRRPYHSPRIDGEELAPTDRPVGEIKHSLGVMRTLQTAPVIRDGPVLAVGGQR